jgi:hypothetical protein
MPVHQWSEIATQFTDGLVLGNGASIAFDPRFRYASLRESAMERGLISNDVQSVFDHLNTVDFELVLRMLWHTNRINGALGIDEPRTEDAYRSVRLALIQVIRAIHVEHDLVQERLPLAARFMRQFSTVTSLNYDVLVYWAILHSNSSQNRHQFKDCFVDRGQFRQDWEKLRTPIWPAESSTIVGYPHGNLALAADLRGNEKKLAAAGGGANLLESIFDEWNSGNYGPVFVSEGTSSQKMSSIRRSPYLVTIHGELLASMRNSVAIFGWSIGDNDLHLLDSICRGGAIKYAYAVDPNSQRLNDEMSRVENLIVQRQQNAQVLFFDRTSPGCWLVPS